MTLDLRLKAYAPNGASQGLLPAPDDFSLAVPLNDIPSLSLNYGVVGPRSSLLGQPLELAVEASSDEGFTWTEPDDCRFLYLRDGRDPIKTADTWQAEAPGYLWRLQKARVLPEAQAVEGVRTFTNVTPGYILTTLWTEAQSRGALSGMTLTGDSTNDALGVAWGTTLTRSYDVGTDYLQVVLELAQTGFLDFRMAGRTLKVYRPDVALATDRTVGNSQVQLTPLAITEAPFRRTWEGLADFLHVAGDEGSSVDLTNVDGLKPWGRWEDYITQGGVQDAGTLTAIGQRYQTLTAAERAEFTQGLAMALGPVPLVDFWPGDYIWSRDLAGVRTKYRVRQVTLQKSGSTVQGNVVLNDRFLEEDARTRRAIEAITGGATAGGSTGGTPAPSFPGSDILQPATPATPTVTSAVYQDPVGNALAQITVDWPDVTTNLDGTAITDLDHYEVQRKVGATGSSNPWAEATRTEGGTSLVTMSPFTPGTIWSFRVRAVDSSTNASAWSAAAQVTAAGDTTPPPTPSTPTQTSRASVANVVWDGLTSTGAAMPVDFFYVEVHVTTTTTAPTAGSATTMRDVLTDAGQVPITGIPYGSTYYGWLIARDRSMNASGASARVSLTAPFLVAEDILNGAINTAKVSGALFTGTVIPNPQFEEWNDTNTAPLGWTVSGAGVAAPTKETAAPLAGSASLRLNPTATVSSLATTAELMPVVPGDIYYLAATGKVATAGATASKLVAVRWHDAAGTFISSNNIVWPATDTTATRREAAFTAPATAKSALIRAQASLGDTVDFIVDELDWRRLITTALIADLAVVDAKITSLSAAKITTGLLQATQRIVAGASLTGPRAEMNPAGFLAYGTNGTTKTFEVRGSDGYVYILGDLVAGSNVTGATITGGLFRTDDVGQRVELSNSASLDDLRFYSGDALETAPGFLGADMQVYSSNPYIHEYSLEVTSPKVATYAPARLKLWSFKTAIVPGGTPTGGGTGALLEAQSVRLSGDLELDGRIKNGLKVGENSLRTTVIHAASITLTVSGGAGLATWNHGLNLGTMTYQVLVTSRNNSAIRLFTIDAKASNAVTFRVENPTSGAVVPSGGTANVDVLVIG